MVPNYKGRPSTAPRKCWTVRDVLPSSLNDARDKPSIRAGRGPAPTPRYRAGEARRALALRLYTADFRFIDEINNGDAFVQALAPCLIKPLSPLRLR
jgi:hypothetical protein